jgi:hypothetical protein
MLFALQLNQPLKSADDQYIGSTENKIKNLVLDEVKKIKNGFRALH